MVPERTKFQNKDLLKQNKLKAISGITKFEQLSIAYLEDELVENEQIELDRLLLNSDKKKKEFQIIQNTKLSADSNLIFSLKNNLKKLFIVKSKTKNYRIIYRLAAAFVLLMGLTLLLYQGSRTNLTGKQLTRIKVYPELRKIVQNIKTDIITIRDNNTIAISQEQTEKQTNRQTILIPEKLVTMKCNAVQYDGIEFDSDRLAISIYYNTYTLNSTYKRKEIVFEKKVRNKINATGKSLFAKSKTYVKKRFSYKKISNIS